MGTSSTDCTSVSSWEIRELILGAVGVSLVVGGTVVLTPNFPIVLNMLLKVVKQMQHVKSTPSKTKIHRTLLALEKQEIISLEQKGQNVVVRVKNRHW